MLFLVCVTGCVTAQSGAMMRARAGLNDKRYVFTLHRLAEAEAYHELTPELKAEISYMKGMCYQGLSRTDEARAMFHYTAEQFPTTEFAYMSRQKLGGDMPPPPRRNREGDDD